MAIPGPKPTGWQWTSARLRWSRHFSFREREAANQPPEFVEYLELSGRPEFNDIFMDVLKFPGAKGAHASESGPEN